MFKILRWMKEQIEKLTHRVSHLEAYEVTEDELNAIERGYSSRQNDVAFLGITTSIFVSFVITLIAVLSNEKTATWTSQFYWAVTVTSGFASAYFLVRWRRAISQDKPIFQKIRARGIGPLGETGKEVKPAELEQMPSSEPLPKE